MATDSLLDKLYKENQTELYQLVRNNYSLLSYLEIEPFERTTLIENLFLKGAK